MSRIRWIGFAALDNMMRTIVHFYPAPRGGVAPYPVSCSIAICSPTIERDAVELDGARLNQPDGVRLEDAFPQLKDSTSGLIGIEITMMPSQQRADVSGSSCIIELTGRDRSVMYHPRCVEGQPAKIAAQVVMRDALLKSSAVVVQMAGESREIEFDIASRDIESGEVRQRAVPSVIGAHQAQEFQLPADVFDRAPVQECGWGMLRGASLSSRGDLGLNLAAYAIHRHAESGKIVSVNAL